MGKKQDAYDKQLNKVRYFCDYNHAARKLLKFKRQHVARAFSASCFKYIRYMLFVLGSLLAVSYFDIPVIESETQIAILFVNFVVLYLILTFVLYCLSFLYFPICKMISYIKHIGDEDPYKSTGNMAEDTKRLYIASEKLEKEANHLWSTWWHALYVKRSRILKILTAICCGGVLFLKGYFCVESDIHAVFEKYHLFAGGMATSDVVVLSAIGIVFVLVVYFVQWPAFYFSDRMILATQFKQWGIEPR